MGSSAIPLIGAGGLLSAYGSLEAGKENRRISRFNAEVARMQGQQALQEGEQEAKITGLKGEQLLGAQRSSEASQGIVVGAGTARAVEDASAAMTEMDKMMIRINAGRKAMGYESRAQEAESQGNRAYRAGVLNAAGSLLQTGGNIAMTNARSHEVSFG